MGKTSKLTAVVIMLWHSACSKQKLCPATLVTATSVMAVLKDLPVLLLHERTKYWYPIK